MSKKNRKKNNLKEDKIMNNENNNVNVNTHEIIINNDVIEEEFIGDTEVLDNQEEVSDNQEEALDNREEVLDNQVNIDNDNVENNEVIGKIVGFDKLYVRKNPNKDSEPVGIVTKEEDLSIDLHHSTDDYYKVITSNNLEGFCVKEFVKIV